MSPRPPPIPPTKTLIYKTAPSTFMDTTFIVIPPIPIKADIYLPSPPPSTPCPIILFIHGGGWINSNRTDYSRPLFHHFLARNFIVCSMDYRLLPETPFSGQCEDVKDMEKWLRKDLANILKQDDCEVSVDGKKIIIVGASSGAHLALLIPKLWASPPHSILSLYGPTCLHHIPFLNLGKFSRENFPFPPCTPFLLAHATTYANPPTERKIEEREEEYKTPRRWMGQHVYRGELLGEFLVRGLVCEGGMRGKELLRLPDKIKDNITKEEIDEISPFHLCTKIKYPPVYQLVGTEDTLFELSQMRDFERATTGEGGVCVTVEAEGMGHGFDVGSTVGDRVDREWLVPAVDWVCGWVDEKLEL